MRKQWRKRIYKKEREGERRRARKSERERERSEREERGRERERDRRVSSGGAFFSLVRSREGGREWYISPSLSVPRSVCVRVPLVVDARAAGRGGTVRASERASDRTNNSEKAKEEDESGEKGRSVGVSTPGGRLPANDAGPIKRARFVTVQSAATCDQHLRRIAVCAGKMGCAASRRGRPT